MQRYFEVNLRDWALLLSIDFDSFAVAFFGIHFLCFKLYWVEQYEPKK